LFPPGLAGLSWILANAKPGHSPVAL